MLNHIISLCLSPDTTVLAMQVVFALCVLILTCFYTVAVNLKNKGVLNAGIRFRMLSLIISFIPLFWSLYLWSLYDSTGQTFQMVCYLNQLHLSFGVDSIGLALIVLTCALFPLCLILMRTFTGIMCFLLLEIVILGS